MPFYNGLANQCRGQKKILWSGKINWSEVFQSGCYDTFFLIWLAGICLLFCSFFALVPFLKVEPNLSLKAILGGLLASHQGSAYRANSHTRL